MVKTTENLIDKVLGRKTDVEKLKASLEKELALKFPISTYTRSEDEFTEAFGGSVILRVPVYTECSNLYPTNSAIQEALDKVYKGFKELDTGRKKRTIAQHGPYYYIFID